MLKDHLSSTSSLYQPQIETSPSPRIRYSLWGGMRDTSAAINTTLRYTVQRDETYISMGKDTVISIRNTVLGQIPESNIDALIRFLQVKYDLERLKGVDPGGKVVIIGNDSVNPSLGKDLRNFLLNDW